MDNDKPIEVGTLLDNGDTVFHITDTEYWVVAPQSLWKVSTWEGASRHCQGIGYELPSRDVLQVLDDASEFIDHVFKEIHCCTMLAGIYFWSSTEDKSYSAWLLDFGLGNWYASNKRNRYWVVPVRRFQKQLKLQGQVAYPVDR
jgi:hypothetical protein